MRRVRFTTTGWMESPGYMLGLPHSRKVPVPVTVAVCERDDGTILLVDTGWGAETCANPRSLGVMHRRTLGVRVRPGDDVASQLRRAGLDPAQVTTIVATHLHLDHVGGAGDFPNAELVATHDEMAAAYRASWLQGYRMGDIDRAQRLRLVQLRPTPRLGFPNSYEVDPDVTLLDTWGHTAGHTAAVIRENDRTWIHGGDIAYLQRELQTSTLSPLSRFMAHDVRAARSAQRKLKVCLRDNPDMRLVLSHEPNAFAKLPHLLADLDSNEPSVAPHHGRSSS